MVVLVIAENIIGVDMEQDSSCKLKIFWFFVLQTHWLNN